MKLKTKYKLKFKTMALNRSKGNMYDFVTHTWNTVKGECPHGCSYCYMRRWGKQPKLRFDEKELKTDLGSDNFIFVGSSCDMWADDIPAEWIQKTLKHCCLSHNDYLFQSKNPARIWANREILPACTTVCTTIESDIWHYGSCPKSSYRANYMNRLSNYFETYVTIEPICDFNLYHLVELIKLCHPKQVNIGADSGNNNLPEPSKEKILALIDELKKFTIIDQKRNLKRLL